MPKNTLESVLREALKRITRSFRVDLVLLHGSYAKGTYIDEFSDVDLLIVSDDFEGMPIGERFSMLAELLSGMEKAVEAFAYTRREFLENMRNFNPLVLDALEYGVPLLKSKFYDEALKEFKRLKEIYKLKPLKRGWTWTSPQGGSRGGG